MKTTTLQHKAFSADVKISADDARTVRAVISSSAVDREGDVLIPQGLNSKDFEANPVVMLMHSYYNLPIGKVTAIKRGDETVEAKIEFAERPNTHPMDEEWVPDTIFSLFKQGVMNAFSVGFIPTDARAATSRDVTKFGEDCRQVINRWKLLELSVVGIPCNQEAIALAVSKGFQQDQIEKLFTKAEPADERPAMATCSKCDKEYAQSDMTMDDGDWVCSDCMADPEDEEAKAAVEPEAKEVTRTITSAKRIVTAVELTPEPVACVKHVTRFIPPHEGKIVEKTHKTVVRTVKKLRGQIYCD